MLIVKVFVNDDWVETMTALNVEGNLNGLCEYECKSTLYGSLGKVIHNRPDGLHALVEKMCDVANDKRKTCVCAKCNKLIEGNKPVTYDNDKTYHSDCYFRDLMSRGEL